ncbi:MAG: flavodoxin family protein [Desulfobacterales bacterium]|nr:flavodoxin family protein [Desulfobacterales bacterium]
MQKILGVIGSPRKLGNSEIMVKEISRNITAPHELELLRLSDFDIRPCQGCYQCLFKEKCIMEDDYHQVTDAVLAADALILAVPAYFLGPNSVLKRFTDRGLALYSSAEKMWGKPAVAVGIAGIPGKEGYTLLGLESAAKLLFADLKQSRMVYGALPGEIFLNASNRKIATELAGALFEPTSVTQSPHCPLCNGSTFRFLEHNKVRCMLCSNTGTIDIQAGTPVFQIQADQHEFFLDLKAALDHRDWLIGMKSRFMENRAQLKKVRMDYREAGTWIKPDSDASQ